MQRDSDANRDVLASRDSALRPVFCFVAEDGANLISQFKTDYIPRVFCATLPRVVGGPDPLGEGSRRGTYYDSGPVSLAMYTTMIASRCEYQIRADWDFNPGIFSLAFASRVNLGQPMPINRALRRGAGEEDSDASIGEVALRIYKLLHELGVC
ncbi:hypothetical protein N9L19_00230 [bacterium]|nr:hypothetical protein [bacterium]